MIMEPSSEFKRALPNLSEQEPPSQIDMQEVQEIGKRGRLGTLQWKHEAFKEVALRHNLEILEIGPPISESVKVKIDEEILKQDHNHRYIIGVRKTLEEGLKDKLQTVHIPQLQESIKNLYEGLKGKSIVDAMHELVQHGSINKDTLMERPEVAALEGLIFGYKPCDIEYYIRTRYFGGQRHSYEEVAADLKEHALCEACAKELLDNNK